VIISNNQIERVLQSYIKQVSSKKSEVAGEPRKKDEVASVERSDKVSITRKSEEFQKAMELYSKLPDIREKKVEEAKERIEKGSYEVSSREIAEKIIYRSVVDKVV